ncbi:CTP synthase (glutamine hydrolyzing) [candidate division WOR-3 bacterium]|nr:CTP synthase (glutamine hydrolyzing) [candidate division WOR-3 bacterium]
MKYIVVVGGVLSGIGKGVATASIARMLKEYGFKTTAIKIDPYINYDAGTLRPTEHGEVWVTDDGGEIDQDLGNYERFLGENLPKRNNITTGQIYKAVIDRERRGEYLGQTVQFIPHIPNEIKSRVRDACGGNDVCLIEIGGTIGDYENIPFLFAVKSMEREEGKENFIYVLLTYLPIPSHIHEMKTKPTQQAIKSLSQHGIFPDFILCRSEVPLDLVRKKKIETYANIDAEFVISAPDVETIYQVPLNFEKENLSIKIMTKLALTPRRKPDWSDWQILVKRILQPSRTIDIAIVGKYIDVGEFTLTDSYISVNQAVEHAGAHTDTQLKINWVDAKRLEEEEPAKVLNGFSGIIVPGGFGNKGIEGKINAIRFAREQGVPFLGLCLGMQLAVVEFARNVLGMVKANSTEFDPKTPYPVIDLLPKQKEILQIKKYGASMRLGAYVAQVIDGVKVFELYKKTGRMMKDKETVGNLDPFRVGNVQLNDPFVVERHRHRYEVNPVYIDSFEKEGMIFSGYHVSIENEYLMEFVELKDHIYFVATQAHPEFKSRIEDPAPLFLGFAEKVVEYAKKD